MGESGKKQNKTPVQTSLSEVELKAHGLRHFIEGSPDSSAFRLCRLTARSQMVYSETSRCCENVHAGEERSQFTVVDQLSVWRRQNS